MIRLLIYWIMRHRVHLPLAVMSAVIVSRNAAWLGVSSTTAFALSLFALLSVTLNYWIQVGTRLREFCKVTGRSAVIYFAPGTENQIDVHAYLTQWEECLQEFECLFEGSLKRRLHVYLFRTMADLEGLFQWRMGACALPGVDAVFVAADAESDGSRLITMRHELTHLYSPLWGPSSPALKIEGLAVLLQQEDWYGRPIDSCALLHVMGSQHISLSELDRPGRFYQDSWRSYFLAGSFTGYLIRQYGWQKYRLFYRRCRGRNLPRICNEVFGASLPEVERHWRAYLLSVRRKLAGDRDFSTQLRIHRAHTFLLARLPYQCLKELACLVDEPAPPPAALWSAACAHLLLHDFEESSRLLQLLEETDDAWWRRSQSLNWVAIGILNDFQNRRQEAIRSYRNSLEEPDCYYNNCPSVHDAARAGLKRVASEDDLMRLIA